MIVVVTSEKDLDTETKDEEPADEAVGETEGADDDAVEGGTQARVEDLDEDAEDEEEGDGRPLKGKRDKAKDATWRSRPWRQYLRRSALPLLLSASLLVSGFLGWKQWQAHQLNEAGEQARQAAIAYAGVLTSIDSNNVDQNFRQVLDGATGEFKDMYTQSSVQLRQLLIDNKATAHGVVVDSAIASESMGKVVVLLFIDQTVTNAQVPDPRIDRSRIKITMEKIDGRWKASKVQLL
jgi:Mce-associated membrane protein